MYSHDAFHARINANPEDHTTRAVYADWLEENHPELTSPEFLTALRENCNPMGIHFNSEGQLHAFPAVTGEQVDQHYNDVPNAVGLISGEFRRVGSVHNGPNGSYYVLAHPSRDTENYTPHYIGMWDHDTNEPAGLQWAGPSAERGHRIAEHWSGMTVDPGLTGYARTDYDDSSEEAGFRQYLSQNPHDSTARAAFADWLREHDRHEEAGPHHVMAQWMNEKGGRVMTVARHGARTTGRYPIFITGEYTATPRRDGTWTWRRTASLGQSKSGMGPTGPMIAEAQEWADHEGVPYLEGVRHGHPVDWGGMEELHGVIPQHPDATSTLTSRYARTDYADANTINAALTQALQRRYEPHQHGVIADMLDEHMGEPSVVADLIRRQYGQGLYGGRGQRDYQWWEPFTDHPQGEHPFAADLGTHGPFDLHLLHEGGPRQGENQRWVVRAASNLPGSEAVYNFEFPHEEAHEIPRMFPAARQHIDEWITPDRFTDSAIAKHRNKEAEAFRDMTLTPRTGPETVEGGMHDWHDPDPPDAYTVYADELDPQDRASFEAAIDANPNDELTHGAYADWLQDRGHDQEADFRRKMGHWWARQNPHGMTGHADGDHPYHIRGPFSTSITPGPDFPEGVDSFAWARGAEPTVWHGSGDFFTNRRDPYHARWNWMPETFSWASRHDMEEAFRRAHARGGVGYMNATSPVHYADHADLPAMIKSIPLRAWRGWNSTEHNPPSAGGHFSYAETTEDDFHRLLDQNPDDHQTRQVFADWLQERNDPRAEGYRALGQLRRRPFDDTINPLDPTRGPLFVWGIQNDPQILNDEWTRSRYPDDVLLHPDWVRHIEGSHPHIPSSETWSRHSSRRRAEDQAALAFNGMPPDVKRTVLGLDPPPDVGSDEADPNSQSSWSSHNLSRNEHPSRYADTLDPQDQASFETAIDANPHEELVHGAYADWLQDRGHDQEADFRRKMGHWWARKPLVDPPEGHSDTHHLPGPFGNEDMPKADLPEGVTGFPFVWEGETPVYDPNGDPVPGPRQPHHPKWNWMPETFSWASRHDMEEAFRRAHARGGVGYMNATSPVHYADHADLPAMIKSIPLRAWRGWNSTEHNPPFDMTPRVVAADMLDELGRGEEAATLRDTTKHAYWDGQQVGSADEIARERHAVRQRAGHGYAWDLPRDERGLFETALWASNDNTGTPLSHGAHDIHPETMGRMLADWRHFRGMNQHIHPLDEARDAQDFWMSRNGHGTGFFDREHESDVPAVNHALQESAQQHGPMDLYVGDDGMIHGS